MSVSARRDTILVETVILQQDTKKYAFVNRDGSLAGAGEDAFGVTMTSEDSGDPVAVCRLGFCPGIVASAADNTADGTELAVTNANGELGAPTAEDFVVARSEEATGSDGAQTGLWVDCVSAGRQEPAAA